MVLLESIHDLLKWIGTRKQLPCWSPWLILLALQFAPTQRSKWNTFKANILSIISLLQKVSVAVLFQSR